MLRLPAFELRRPETLEEAAALLAEGPGRVRLLAGGTDLFPNLKRRHQKAEVVVSLSKVPGLGGIREEADGAIVIGAGTTLSEMVESELLRADLPALVAAVASISAPVLRNMGTLGGNLCLDTRCTYYNQTEEWRRSIEFCLKEEGKVCWVAPGSPRCWAVSSSDSAPMLCALEAEAQLVSSQGERWIPLPVLYQDDGITYLTKRPEEILTAVRVPAASRAARCRSAFRKLRRRGSIDFAVLSVGAALWLADDGTVEKARVFLGAVASQPVEAAPTAQALLGKPLDAETLRAAADLARREATPMDNTDLSPAWRGAVLPRYVEAALRECAG